MFPSLQNHSLTEPPVTRSIPVAPDWYGIGKEADQMQNVLHLIPKPPQGNFKQVRATDSDCSS